MQDPGMMMRMVLGVSSAFFPWAWILLPQTEAVWGSSMALCAWWGAGHLWIQLKTKSQLALGVGNGCDDSEELLLIQ